MFNLSSPGQLINISKIPSKFPTFCPSQNRKWKLYRGKIQCLLFLSSFILNINNKWLFHEEYPKYWVSCYALPNAAQNFSFPEADSSPLLLYGIFLWEVYCSVSAGSVLDCFIWGKMISKGVNSSSLCLQRETWEWSWG